MEWPLGGMRDEADGRGWRGLCLVDRLAALLGVVAVQRGGRWVHRPRLVVVRRLHERLLVRVWHRRSVLRVRVLGRPSHTMGDNAAALRGVHAARRHDHLQPPVHALFGELNVVLRSFESCHRALQLCFGDGCRLLEVDESRLDLRQINGLAAVARRPRSSPHARLLAAARCESSRSSSDRG